MLDGSVLELLDGMRTFKEWKDLHLVTTYVDKGGADTGGTNEFPHGKYTLTPGIGGTSFSFKPILRTKGQPWDNVYISNTLTKDKVNSIYFGYQLQFMFPSDQLIKACQAFEFELELCENGLVYNMAWQYLIHGNLWRWFNQNTTPRKWVEVPGLPNPNPKANTPVNVLAHFKVDRSTKITTHDSIVIDGAFYPLNISNPAKAKWNPGVNYLHNAIQLDSDGKGTPCGILLKGMNARAL